jgi:hypothetical protein
MDSHLVNKFLYTFFHRIGSLGITGGGCREVQVQFLTRKCKGIGIQVREICDGLELDFSMMTLHGL